MKKTIATLAIVSASLFLSNHLTLPIDSKQATVDEKCPFRPKPKLAEVDNQCPCNPKPRPKNELALS